MAKWQRIGAAALAAGLAAGILVGCGGTSGNGGSSGGTVKIASLLPVAGTDASVGLPVQYGVDLAVSQNTNLGGGYTLAVDDENYSGANGPDQSIATGAASRLVSDSQVMAIIGPFNSGITKVVMPITNGATLVSISPANTNPGLTLRQYADANSIDFDKLHPAGKPNAYFRLPGNDVVQGSVLAKYSAQQLNAKTAYVVDDNSVYGLGLATYFTQTFKSNGGNVVNSTHITAAQVSNLNSLADQIKGTNADIVFFGGIVSGGGGALKKALVAKGFNKPMVGGDGIAQDPGFITTAGADAAVNAYGTVAAPDVSALSSGAASKFSSDYKAFVQGKPNNDLIAYSAMSYDATNIVIKAMKDLIAAGKPITRTALRDQVAATHYDGVTGSISFDENGDNAGAKVFSVYVVDPSSKQWVYKTQVTG